MAPAGLRADREPARNHADRGESFRKLLFPIFCVVQGVLIIGFIFSIYVSLEYEKHNAQIRFINAASEIRVVLAESREALFGDGNGERESLSLDSAGSGSPASVISALLVNENRAVIEAVYRGKTRTFYKGIGPDQAADIAFLAAPGSRTAGSVQGWRNTHRIGPVPFGPDGEGSFTLTGEDVPPPFIADFVFNKLWPFMAGAVLLAVAIAWASFRFVRRRYDEVEQERGRFRDFAACSSDWFWEMDESLRFSYFSQRFSEVTGVPQERLLGRTREEDGNPGAEDEDWQKHLATLHACLPFRNFIHSRTKSDGTRVWLSVSGSPVFDGGRFRGYRGTGRDITRQRLHERQLQTAIREAERASRSKSEFLAAVSHDLRTPLNAILGFSDIIRNQYFGSVGQRYREYADDIHSSGGILLSLVEEVLDFSAIEAGKRTLDIREVNLRAVTEHCGKLLQQQATAKGVTLATAVSGAGDVFRTDERAVRQILQNLASNSLKFTPAGGKVTIGTELLRDHVVLTVRDTGKGMTEEEIVSLVEPFTKGRDSSYITEEGWGLGLSIVRSLVQLLDGDFDIESTVGEGTLVTVTIPRASQPEQEVPASPVTAVL
jgi:PAS domain S-box-containing protein